MGWAAVSFRGVEPPDTGAGEQGWRCGTEGGNSDGDDIQVSYSDFPSLTKLQTTVSGASKWPGQAGERPGAAVRRQVLESASSAHLTHVY